MTTSSDGRTAAVARRDESTVALLDLATGSVRGTLATSAPPMRLVLSPDGSLLAVMEYPDETDQDEFVSLWDVARRRLVTRLSSSGGVGYPSFSPDGRILATSGLLPQAGATEPDGVTFLWEVGSWRRVGALTTGGQAAVFSPGGKLLAVDKTDGHGVDLWDLQQRRRVGQLVGGHDRGLLSMAFSPDGRLLASGGHDGTTVLWDVERRSKLRVWQGTADVVGLTFSPDGKTLAAGDNVPQITLWDVVRGRQIRVLGRGHTATVTSVLFQPDGTLISAGWDGRIVRWNLSSPGQLAVGTVSGTSAAPVPALSPDGRTLAMVDGTDVVLWTVPELTRLGTLPGAGTNPVFSPAGTEVVTAAGHQVVVWNVTDRRRLRTLPSAGQPADDGEVPVLAFSPDGLTLASGEGATISLWNTSTWTERARLALGTKSPSGVESVTALEFSPDSKLLAVAVWSFAEAISLWDVASASRVDSVALKEAPPVDSFDFSPDSRTLAWSERTSSMTALRQEATMMTYDIASHSRHEALVSRQQAGAVAFTADPDLVVWESDTVSLWSISRQSELAALAVIGPYDVSTSGADGDLTSEDLPRPRPAVSHDGRLLATSIPGAGVALWDLDPESWARKVCAVAGGGISAAEWPRRIPDVSYRETCPS